ncbi:MAG: hypothetical protein KF777_24705 [Planctomycetaceae bacterium]|nr:hypothetical protein [Planctomycetaceae bacterium]
MMMTIPMHPMNDTVSILNEPRLEFAGGHLATDPHDGLALFGPFSNGTSSSQFGFNHIVVGAPGGVAAWQRWAAQMNRAIGVTDRDTRLWPPYPGFDVTFSSPWPENPVRTYKLDRDELITASRKRDPHERSYSVVNQVMDRIIQAKKLDLPLIAICVIPDEVWANCRPESHVLNPSDHGITSSKKKSRQAGQLELFEEYDADQYHFAPDFRRQLKARTMGLDIPVQIIRESTLRLTEATKFGERGLTPLSDRLWNIGTALYYKSGGKPWRLADAREGVCYIGLAFRRAGDGKRTACCAAQMFLDSGDGIVFLGEYGPWYSPDTHQFRLSPDAAEKLLRGALNTYEAAKTPDDPPLREIFLHSRSQISDEEFAGYSRACPDSCKLVGIRVRRDRFGPRLFRDGRMPVMRGTLWTLDRRSAYLYASGFKERIANYDGWEVPAPLKIDIQHGEADIGMVARDIYALTKLNYNACRLGDSQPVTVLFSDAVGEILIANPTITDRRPNFKYYI